MVASFALGKDATTTAPFYRRGRGSVGSGSVVRRLRSSNGSGNVAVKQQGRKDVIAAALADSRRSHSPSTELEMI